MTACVADPHQGELLESDARSPLVVGECYPCAWFATPRDARFSQASLPTGQTLRTDGPPMTAGSGPRT